MDNCLRPQRIALESRANNSISTHRHRRQSQTPRTVSTEQKIIFRSANKCTKKLCSQSTKTTMSMPTTTHALAETQKRANATIPPLADGWHIRHNMPTRCSAGLLRYDSVIPAKSRLRPSPLVAMARDYVRQQWTSTTSENEPYLAQQRRTALFHREYKQLRDAERNAMTRQKALEQSQSDFLKTVQEENYDFNYNEGRYGYDNFLGYLISEWDAAKDELFARVVLKFDAITKDLSEQSQDLQRELDCVHHDMTALKRRYQAPGQIALAQYGSMMAAQVTLPLSPMPGEEVVIGQPRLSMQCHDGLEVTDWSQGFPDDAGDAERDIHTRLADFNNPNGWTDVVANNSTCLSEATLADPKDRVDDQGQLRNLKPLRTMEYHSLSPQYGGAQIASEESNKKPHLDDNTYASHRLRMEKLRTDFKRIQKLESQAMSRLDRIRHMKDQLTDRMQVCRVLTLESFNADKMQMTQQEFLSRLTADGSVPLPLSTNQNEIGHTGNGSREATIKSESSSFHIDGNETVDGSQVSCCSIPGNDLNMIRGSGRVVRGEPLR
nr:hypothetical protein CFP56_20931 [Quercus suber]